MKFTGKVSEPHRVNEHVFHGGKVIAVFRGGEFETDDEAVAQKLTELGYTSPLPVDIVPVGFGEEEYPQMKEPEKETRRKLGGKR